MSVFRGKITSVSIGGRTYEVFDVVIGEANAKMSEAILGQNLTTEVPASSLGSALVHITELKLSRPVFNLDLEVVIGTREMRRLLTGRPRPPRAETQSSNRRVKRARRKLRNLANLRMLHGPEWFERALHNVLCGPGWTKGLPRGVSVPRSLRPFLGRWLGGDQ